MLALADDERLAALAAGGSERAFGELVQRHEARLLMVSRSVLRSDKDARDAVQNALLKAFRALQEGQLRGAPRPWLARIAHNEARSLARVPREFTPLDPESLGVAGDPHDAVLAQERLAALVADIAALPERLRQPLLLRAEGGLSYDAIARSLGTTAGAARQPCVTPARLWRPTPRRARPTAPTSARSSRPRPPAPPLAARPRTPAGMRGLPCLAAGAPPAGSAARRRRVLERRAVAQHALHGRCRQRRGRGPLDRRGRRRVGRVAHPRDRSPAALASAPGRGAGPERHAGRGRNGDP